MSGPSHKLDRPTGVPLEHRLVCTSSIRYQCILWVSHMNTPKHNDNTACDFVASRKPIVMRDWCKVSTERRTFEPPTAHANSTRCAYFSQFRLCGSSSSTLRDFADMGRVIPLIQNSRSSLTWTLSSGANCEARRCPQLERRVAASRYESSSHLLTIGTDGLYCTC